jgi:3D-(3,5/4)-trihydroxycyclohexane-1,2-dione acylhydrolase (decyclizing)
VVRTDPTAWTDSGAWWEVGVPETLAGRVDRDRAKTTQLRYLAGGAPGRSSQ